MEDMNTEVAVETKPSREKKVNTKAEPAGLKIAIPAEISQRLQDSYNTLKERGYTGRIEDLMTVLWEQVTGEWCEARVEALTPDEYYLEATKQIPEVRQKLVDQAKKALLKAREGNC
jgi:hypothetical protein